MPELQRIVKHKEEDLVHLTLKMDCESWISVILKEDTDLERLMHLEEAVAVYGLTEHYLQTQIVRYDDNVFINRIQMNQDYPELDKLHAGTMITSIGFDYSQFVEKLTLAEDWVPKSK